MSAHRRQALLLLLASVCTLAAGSHAQKRLGKQERAEDIIARVEQRYAGIKDYTVDLDISVDIPGLTIPPVHAIMYFKQPDKVQFKSEGFAMLPRETAGLGIGRIRSSNMVEDSVAREMTDGGIKLRISMIPKADKTRLRRILLYVDPNRWTADRAVTNLPDGRTGTAVFQYQQLDEFWLPSSLTLSFTSAGTDSADVSTPRRPGSSWTPEAPREGTVLVQYSHYRINTGLSDDVFKPEDAQEQR
jgi:hypothetical protein